MSISDRISALNPQQRELLEVLRRKSERPAAPAGPPPIARRPALAPNDGWPLALDQERLWFLYQLDPSDPSYNLPTATRLRGRLHPAVLSRGMDEIVRRHEAWRTSFPEVDGRPVQVIARPAPVPFPQVDLSGLPEALRELEAARQRLTAGRRPFDLERGPLLRVLLVRLAPDLHEIVLVVHHIVADWYSSVLFWGELQKLYPALLAGRPADLPELPVQYADFALWQRELLSGPALQPHLDYWLRHLEGAPLALELPTDRPRPAHFTTRGHRIPFQLTRATSSGLKALAQRERVTPFMLVLALFQALLSRWSGQDRILVSAPNANRNREELQSLLGFFLTQLVFSTDLGGDPTFRELLRRVRQVALAAYAHQDVPFGKLVEALRPERDTSRPPIAQVDLLVLEAGDEEQPFGNLAATSMDVDTGTSAFELTLALWDASTGYSGYLEHNADLFDPTTGGRLAEGFLALLDAVLARADAPLSALPVQGETAAHQAQIEWNDTAAPRQTSEELLHTRFFARAARTPGAVAVIDGRESLTYGELAARAGALAESLRRLGIGPEDRVAICLPRSADLVAALLGVLAAGGAYVPLDPAYPQERREMMVADAGARVVIEEKDLKDPKDVKDNQDSSGQVSLKSFESFRSFGSFGALAYLIYTSGSTGRPKAVGIEHRSVVTFLDWASDAFAEELAGGVLASTSVCFDLSVFEIFGPLSCGGTVILAENALALPELPAAGRVGLINTVPSALTELLRLGGLPASVRTVNLAGEVLPRRLAEEVHRRVPSARLFNLYGPSEDTTYSTWALVPPGSAAEPAIGRPVAGTRVVLLDRELRPVPLGGRGELCLAGDGLARGYLGRPELTAERFVPDPFAARPGERLYRTGDLARWRAHSELELLGRADRQVKVRGFRVEPAEIEALLGSHPEVREAAVAVRDGRLAAWVVPRNGLPQPGQPPDLRGFLLARLPRHMVPSLWSTLPALPLTPNGKIDYRALPDPEAPAAGAAGYRAPRTRAEERLAAVWAEVLGLPRVGVHDNFFRLGGDSILSIRLVARARQAGLILTPRQIFERQTVAELAAVAPLLDPSAVIEDAGPVTGEAPLTPIQRWFLEADPVDPHHYNQAVLLETRGPVEDGWLRRAIAGLLAHHDALRLRFAVDRSWFTSPPAEPPVSRLDLSALPEPLHRPALEDAAGQVQASLDLAAGPLFRAAMFDLGAERSGRLLLVIHHLVVDGVSWRILLEDLQAFPHLPPKTTSWKRWAERLVEHARSAEARSEAEVWLGLPEPGPEPLPVDRSGDDSEVSDAAVSVALSPESTRAFLRDAAAAWHTRPDDLLLAAVARAFAAWTGSPRLAVWLEGHGREEIFPDVDLSRTVGWFTSLAPVALDLAGATASDNPGEAIRRVKESLRAIPRRGIGYGLLRWLADPEEISARLAARREPEVVFNYLGQLDLVLPEGSRFVPAVEPSGSPRSPRADRRHRIEINAGVLGGRLEVHWGYGRNVHERATIETLARRFLAELEALIEHCLTPGAGGWTPSDFPLARLDQAALDRLPGNQIIEDVYPLSPMQAGLLFHGLYAPATEIYFEQITCTLRGDLDAGAFRRAWQRLLDRHGILRTELAWEGLEEPLQVVRRGIEMPWTEEDWRGPIRAGADPDARLAAFAAADRRQAFDLRRAPLLRAALLRTGEREHRFVWSFHHLLLDGWSLPPLFAEVFALYEGRPLPAPVLPYRDFVAWLARRDGAADERYWRQALAGIDGPTPLPWDTAAAAPAERADEFTQHEVLLPEDATAALDAFARERGLTLNTVVQGAWGLLLSRWSGERDVVFGAVAAGRPPELPGFETALGLFINTLPVRLEAAPEQPLAAWLGAHQRAQIEARQHEQAPLAEVQRWSGVPAREPLVHSLLVFENYPLDAAVAETGSLELADVRAVERTSYPLSLAVVPGRRLRLRITHDRRLEPATGDRLLGWLTRLLDGFTAGPDRALRDFELLSEAERAQILRDQDTSMPLPAEPALRRFERWVAATPDAPAVRDAAETLSFAELDRRAEQHAEHLRARGIEPGSCVPLEAERSANVLVGMLGIWKAGAAWVAIDPSRPSPPAPLPQDSLAYVLYTSGSTGTPKGVMVDHAALAGYLAWIDEVLLAPVDYRLPATSGLTFDASLKQLLGPLLAGREVRILPEETATRPVALANALAAEGFKAWNGVPALWSAVLDAIESGDAPRPEALERVLLGGEGLPPELVDRTRRLLPRVEVWNLYGPTEATANATAARLAPGDRVHLGPPLPGVRTCVLDREGRLVPPGASGELCLAGAGLARGYLGRPDLTAERFLPDPFSRVPGERLYRTGDLVRLAHDGRLEHRGRVDSQVKIRGMRIELGEIEAALHAHPAVRDAIVTVRKDLPGGLPGDIRLAAWISSAEQVPAADLKAWLRERLPAAAVPADLVVLPDLPRLPNGKLDRRALAARVPDTGSSQRFEAPANDVEEKLAGLWSDLLKVERVGRGDNFFDLGGHSLLATRLMVRIRDAFGVTLPLPAIFEAEDLAALAGEILALRLRTEDPDDLARLMADLDGLSDDQVESLLAQTQDQKTPEQEGPP